MEESRARMAELTDKVGLSDDEKKEIVDFGKKAYPLIFGYFKIFNSCCRKREEAGIHNYIKDEFVRARFDKFLREGGDIEKIRQGKVDEEYLISDDIEEFKKAEKIMHAEVAKETVSEISGGRKGEYEEYVADGSAILEKIEEKLAALRKMAGELPDQSAEIFVKIAELSQRWVNFANEPSVADVDELLEFYGAVESIEGGEVDV